MAQRLFVFLQLEFPWLLGPADGRHLLRTAPEGDAERVLVFSTLASSRADQRSQSNAGTALFARITSERGRGIQATDPGPEPVSTARVTVIDPVPLSAENQAQAWLAGLDAEREVTATVAIVNRVLYWQRVAAADPHLREVSASQALTIRAGWGEGEQVADGRWLHAQELGPHGAAGRRTRRRDRSWALRPQERLAALLGRRDEPLICEDLALRARADLDAGRDRHAAIELERALATAVAELRAEGRQDLAIRVAELEQLHAGIAELAEAAVATAPDPEPLAHALERLEAALRARTATGLG
jgi:hypothetical protein